jgi:hypothetical protein
MWTNVLDCLIYNYIEKKSELSDEKVADEFISIFESAYKEL